eukprot:Gb_34349 [translate_table: standard]
MNSSVQYLILTSDPRLWIWMKSRAMVMSTIIIGPVNYVCLQSVTPSLRPLSMAMSTVCIHIFGDVPSSPLVGVLQLATLYLSHDIMILIHMMPSALEKID